MITLERQSILSTEICAAASPADVLSALVRITREYGFQHFVLLQMPGPDEVLLSRTIVESNLPSNYTREFDKRRLLRKCSLSPLVVHSPVPLCWSIDDCENIRGFGYPPELIDLHRRYEMATNVSMAQHSIDGDEFRMVLSGTRPRLTQVELNEVGMVLLEVFCAFDRIRRAGKMVVSTSLSTRELEVVRWTAQGKTSVEIGRILTLSDHTVNAYLTNAIRKLDCVNRTQLVAKAIRLRLIM